MRTTRAPSVLGVCGWALAPRTAHPRVGSALGSFTWGQCSAVSGCAAHYHTLEQPQSLSTRRTCVSRGRGSTARPITPHPRTRGFHIEGRSSRASDPCIPACASQCVVAPHRHPRTPGTTGMSATCRPGGAGVAARFVAIARDRGDAAWASFCTSCYDPGFIPPLKDTSSTRPRAARIALWRRRAVRAPVGDAAAPFRRDRLCVDATCASCRSPIGSAGSCHCHGLRRIHRHLCSLCSSCVPVRGGPAPARDGQTRQYHRPAAPGRRVAFRADRRR